MYRRYLIVFCALVLLYQVDSQRIRERRPSSLKVTSAKEGFFTMVGDEGDWVTGGGSYTYNTTNGDKFRISAESDLRGVFLAIEGYNGDWFDVQLRAPEDKALVPDEYVNAHRAPFSGAGPGIDIGGNGRGCNTILGSFIVIESKFAPNGQVELLDAAFAQHCEEGATALRGRVRIVDPQEDDNSLLHGLNN